MEEVLLIVEENKIDAFSGNGPLSPEDEELRQLRRENKYLRNGECVKFISVLA